MGAKAGQARKSAGRQRLALILFGAVFVLLFVGFAIAQGITGPSVPSGDIAHISNVPSKLANISEAELKRGVAQQLAASGQKAPKPGSKKYEEAESAVQGELIESVWLRGEAEELGVSITEKQVEEEFANIKKQNFPTEKAYQEFLKKSHYTQEDVNKKVELQVLVKEIQEKVSGEVEPASSAEIQAYYEKEKATQFTTKPSRDVRVVVNENKAEVEKAKEELEKSQTPATWKTVAKKYSSDPTTKTKGGLQPGITEEFVKGDLKAAIFESATGELVGPVKYEKNYLLIEVVKLNPEKVKTLAEVQSQISTTLTQQKQQEHLTEFASSYRNTWTARTVCASGFPNERCSNYPSSKQLAKAREAYKACYEANPKTPAKECPAPVEQTKPALPGSVTVLKPKGEQFPQRPHPEGSSASSEAASALPEGATEAAPETGK